MKEAACFQPREYLAESFPRRGSAGGIKESVLQNFHAATRR